MKIKLGMLNDMRMKLMAVQNKKFPVRVSYAIMRNREAIEKEHAAYESQRIQLCEEYAAKNENGKPIIKDCAYEIQEDKKINFNKELKDLSGEEVDIDIRMVPASEMEKCEEDRYDIPTGADLAILGFMLEEGDK